jgi:serralysin
VTLSIPMQTIEYFENRADGGFAWNVKYDLGANGTAVKVEVRIDLVGADPGSLVRTWEKGAEAIWNEKVFFSDGQRLYAFQFDVDFVNSNAHHTVTVHAGSGRANMTNWYTIAEGWGNSYQDEIAAHEIGHMFGNFDEYAGGATYQGFTSTGSLMSDLTVDDLETYVWGPEFYAEQESGLTLTAIAAFEGDDTAEIITGTAALDGIYGFGGADVLIGGRGSDTLAGGLGSDQLKGGTGQDIFLFDVTLGSTNVDQIAGFDTAKDQIVLDGGIFRALAQGTLAAGAFRIGNAAGDAGDRIIFKSSTGELFYDSDGTGAAAAVKFATITNLTGSLSATDFDIV